MHVEVLVILALALTTSLVYGSGARPTNAVAMKIENNVGQSVDIYWVNTFKNDAQNYVLQNQKPLRNGTSTNIFSYDTHSFIVEFHNPSSTDLSGVHVVFTKGPHDEEIVLDFDPATLKMTATIRTTRHKLEADARGGLDKCKLQVGVNLGAAAHTLSADQMAELTACMTEYTVSELEKFTDAKQQLRESRDKLSYKLRNYTCADSSVGQSKEINSYIFRHKGHESHISTLFEQPAAKIWVAKDFVTPEECKVLVDHGRPRLQRATVAADDGSSVVSENRKAQQAAYMMENPKEDDPLLALYDRVFALANHHAGYNLEWPGQEGFTIIQYNPSDQYTPHCDGGCDGSMHKKHGRVATAVMYCIVPEEGGATTFTNHDITVIPQVGSAAFFSYKDMKTGRMDEGDTEHSGCPVIKGEKWITTVWMREGVSSEPGENWQHFDPDGERMESDAIIGDESAGEEKKASTGARNTASSEHEEL